MLNWRDLLRSSKDAFRRPIALVFHAERLHVDNCLAGGRKIAHRLAIRGLRQRSLFIFSLAAVAAVDIGPRLSGLALLGTRLRNTHIFMPEPGSKNEKVDDLSDANVVHCLQRDFEH